MYNPLSQSQWINDAIEALPKCGYCDQPLASGLHNEESCPLWQECADCGAEPGEPCRPDCLAQLDDE